MHVTLYSCISPDINECIRSSTCVHGTCYNLEGSYACQCHVGFEPSHDNKTCNGMDSDNVNIYIYVCVCVCVRACARARARARARACACV